jgi:C1A family cysteine protease
MGTAMDYIRDNGIMTEKDYPYTAMDGSCAADPAKYTSVKVKSHVGVTPNSKAQLLAAIAQGPVSVAIEADTMAFQFYQGGVLNTSACGTQLDHGVVAIGFGLDSKAKPFYIVRNSWGSGWGESGYIRIAAVEGQGICGIQMEPVYPDL